jgi:hypothetical protein
LTAEVHFCDMYFIHSTHLTLNLLRGLALFVFISLGRIPEKGIKTNKSEKKLNLINIYKIKQNSQVLFVLKEHANGAGQQNSGGKNKNSAGGKEATDKKKGIE